MNVLLTVLLLSAVHVDVVMTNSSETNLLRHLLDTNKQDLLSIPSASHLGETLHLEVGLALKKIIKLDEQNEVLHSQFYLQFMWKDYRLVWNISDFEGLDVIYIHVKKMWTPDAMLHNKAMQQTPGEKAPQSEYVRLRHDGTCIWWPMYEQSVSHCRIDVRRFPFDEQRCPLIYESWKYNSSQLNITSVMMPDNASHYQYNEQWQLLGMSILLTLSVYQITVSNQLPQKSGAVPLIGTYFLFVLILCFVTLATTIFIVHLHTRGNSVSASPMSPTMRLLLCDRLASLLLVRTTTQSSSDGKSRQSDPIDSRHGVSERKPIDRPTAEDKLPSNQVLTGILGLLETRISIDDDKREKSDKDAKMRRDWMLAAAAIDRLCFIAMLIVFVGGTIVFIVLFLQ